jgi:hypothetical protein
LQLLAKRYPARWGRQAKLRAAGEGVDEPAEGREVISLLVLLLSATQAQAEALMETFRSLPLANAWFLGVGAGRPLGPLRRDLWEGAIRDGLEETPLGLGQVRGTWAADSR